MIGNGESQRIVESLANVLKPAISTSSLLHQVLLPGKCSSTPPLPCFSFWLESSLQDTVSSWTCATQMWNVWCFFIILFYLAKVWETYLHIQLLETVSISLTLSVEQSPFELLDTQKPPSEEQTKLDTKRSFMESFYFWISSWKSPQPCAWWRKLTQRKWVTDTFGYLELLAPPRCSKSTDLFSNQFPCGKSLIIQSHVLVFKLQFGCISVGCDRSRQSAACLLRCGTRTESCCFSWKPELWLLISVCEKRKLK